MPVIASTGCAVLLGVVQPVQQVDAARARRRQAHAEPPGELGVAARHKRGGFFVPHMNKTDLVLVGAQRFHDAVDAVAGNPKMVSTPQSMRGSTRMSEAVLSMGAPWGGRASRFF